jgi:putative transposase
MICAPRAPGQPPHPVWGWDITKLLGPRRWTCFYVYAILDVFSRYAVGWMCAYRESAALAERLIAETIAQAGRRRPGALASTPTAGRR